jgi:hypothetical protein
MVTAVAAFSSIDIRLLGAFAVEVDGEQVAIA